MKLNSILVALTVTLLAGVTAAQIDAFHPRKKLRPAAPMQRPLPGGAPQFGDALPGLDAVSRQAFVLGREEFEAVETAAGGLGPIFNGKSCVECHSDGATGGASVITVTRFGRMLNGKFDPMDQFGGSLLQRFAIDPAAQEHVPVEATVVAQRMATPIFGAGLIEAIADQDILLNAQRRQADGVQGRVSMVTDVVSGKQRVGRFGWKAQQATLLAFSGDAYVNEMGITNRFFPKENAPNGNAALLARFDLVADVEDAVDPATGKGDIDHAADFMRLLAPPPALRLSVSAAAGGKLFSQINCNSCHLPVMMTGANRLPALSYQPVALFSDLLLHNMGALGDGIEQGNAKGSDIRTAPLWGLRARTRFLHDGRATTLGDAVLGHAGEGAVARDRFKALNAIQKQQLFDYLKSI